MIKVKRKIVTGEFDMLLNIDSIVYVSSIYNGDENTCFIGHSDKEFKVLESVDSIHAKINIARRKRK